MDVDPDPPWEVVKPVDVDAEGVTVTVVDPCEVNGTDERLLAVDAVLLPEWTVEGTEELAGGVLD